MKYLFFTIIFFSIVFVASGQAIYKNSREFEELIVKFNSDSTKVLYEVNLMLPELNTEKRIQIIEMIKKNLSEENVFLIEASNNILNIVYSSELEFETLLEMIKKTPVNEFKILNHAALSK